MLAEKNEYIEEAAVTMYDVSAEENIRLQCEARLRYEEDRATCLRVESVKECNKEWKPWLRTI